MRRLEVAALALLIAGAAAAALVLLLAVCRQGSSIGKRPAAPELPVSTRHVPTTATKKGWRRRHHHLALLLLLLCSGRRRRRARVEVDPGCRTPSPYAGDAPSSSTAVLEEEEVVAAWRERWIGGPALRALYTIYEEADEEAAGDGEGMDGDARETETPFYTPPASPPRAGGDGGSNGAVPTQPTDGAAVLIVPAHADTEDVADATLDGR